jgi:hypothetical protein
VSNRSCLECRRSKPALYTNRVGPRFCQEFSFFVHGVNEERQQHWRKLAKDCGCFEQEAE